MRILAPFALALVACASTSSQPPTIGDCIPDEQTVCSRTNPPPGGINNGSDASSDSGLTDVVVMNDAQCPGFMMGFGTGFGTNNAVCQGCLASQCCALGQACASDLNCWSIATCVGQCNSNPMCTQSCVMASPAGTGSFDALFACVRASCAFSCVAGPDAG